MMEQKKLSRPNKLGELFLFQISYVLPREYGGRHLLEACPRHVSVHALLAECDSIAAAPCGKICGFNPRTPCGVRQAGSAALSIIIMFQSTHSLRSATSRFGGPKHHHHVSIHALLAECDLFPSPPRIPGTCFNPRTPCGVRHICTGSIGNNWKVSIHALLAECDNMMG